MDVTNPFHFYFLQTIILKLPASAAKKMTSSTHDALKPAASFALGMKSTGSNGLINRWDGCGSRDTRRHTLVVKGTLGPHRTEEGFCFAQGLTRRAGTSSTVPTLRSGCPLFWSSWLRLSTMGGKRQTVNYFVHITRVPQLRQEHLVTVPEITVSQWRTRKVRQMEGQRRRK